MKLDKSLPALSDQALLFGKYLVGSPISQQSVDLYVKAVSAQDNQISDKDSKFLAFALAHPALLPALDAYAALRRPSSELRGRLYLLFSIAEASPDFVDRFLPRKRSPWYLFVIGLTGARAVYRLAFGTVIVTTRRL